MSEEQRARVMATLVYHGEQFGEPFCAFCDEYLEDCDCPARETRAALEAAA